MGKDAKNNPQTLSEEALDRASGGAADAAHTGGANTPTNAVLGDGSVKPGETVGIIAVAPPNSTANKSREMDAKTILSFQTYLAPASNDFSVTSSLACVCCLPRISAKHAMISSDMTASKA